MPSARPTRGTKPVVRDLLVGDDVIAFVGVLADRRLQVHESRDLPLNLRAKLQLREVGVAEAHVVSLVSHAVEILQGVQKRGRHVADMKEVPLRVALEDHHGPVRDGAVHEVVDQQIEVHPRREAEDGGQTERHRVAGRQHGRFGLDLGLAVEADGPQRALFGAERGRLAHPVAAVGVGQDDPLPGRAEREQELDRVQVGRGGGRGVGLAQARRCPTMAARGMITSAPQTASTMIVASRQSPRTTENPGRMQHSSRLCWAKRKLSTTATSYPASSSVGTRTAPM